MSISLSSVCVYVCVGEREREYRGQPETSVCCCRRAGKVEEEENVQRAGEVGPQNSLPRRA